MRRGAGLILGGALTALAACDVALAPPPAPVAAPAPGPVVPDPARVATGPALASPELAQRYRRLEAALLARGLLRTDGGGPDTPFTARQLADNFVRIALFSEYRDDGEGLVSEETESRLRRWEQPVRLEVRFGASVPPERQVMDRNQVLGFARRLAALTGLDIRPVASGGNFTVLFLSEEERRAFGPELRRLIPGITPAAERAFLDLPPDQLCIVIGQFGPDGVRYARAVALVRAEHPDLMRLACIHEEIAQGLGLANDSPRARPSIFNDDEEFALLTTHDELLLRMLYDPRLRPGMSAAEAAPIARRIAAELLGQDA